MSKKNTQRPRNTPMSPQQLGQLLVGEDALSPPQRQAAASTLQGLLSDLERLQQDNSRATQELARVQDLSTRLAACDKREQEVAQRHQALEKQHQALQAMEEQLQAQRREQAQAREELLRQQDQRGRELTQLEAQRLQARHNFAQERTQHLESLRETISREEEALRQLQQQALQSRQRAAAQQQSALEEQARSLDQQRQRHLEELTAELDRLRQEADQRLAQLQQQDEQERQRLTQQHQAWMQNQREDLERQAAQLQQQRLDFQRSAEERQRELGQLQQDLSNLRAQLQTQQSTLALRYQEQSAYQEEQHRQALEAERRRAEHLVGRQHHLERELGRYRQAERRFEGRDATEVLDQLRQLEGELMQLRDELRLRPPASLQQDYNAVREQVEIFQRDNQVLRDEHHRLEQERHNWVVSVGELQSQVEQRELAQHRHRALRLEVEHYQAQVERLQGLFQNPREYEARIQNIAAPVFEPEALPGFSGVKDELAWLAQIEEGCLASGLSFPRRLLYAFHTSLKTADWSPLTVLAGVSGTGKSALPDLYARFGGLLFQSLPVQPNWDSPQSLFGFFNSVDNMFDASELLRAMVQMGQGPCEDRMLLVLLDEMNLAHVELYFSDMLSLLEQRRGKPHEKLPQLSLGLGAGQPQYKVPLTRNVLWVGTMNEDETTRSLSDKVMDRGNLLSFPRPQTLRRRQSAELAPAGAALSASTWQQWQVHQVPFTEEKTAPLREALERINEAMATTGRAIGHRVWQSMEHYMANHPQVRAHTEAGGQPLTQAMRRAFEDAVVQKVMPKLRGLETRGRARTHCLDLIRAQLDELNLDLLDDFDAACNSSHDIFSWNSARYLLAEDKDQ